MLRSFPIHGVLATQVPSSGPESLPPFATRNDPSHSRKDLSLIPEYPPLSRNIPPYPRISPPSFSFATNSSAARSIAPRRSAKNRLLDYQPLTDRDKHNQCPARQPLPRPTAWHSHFAEGPPTVTPRRSELHVRRPAQEPPRPLPSSESTHRFTGSQLTDPPWRRRTPRRVTDDHYGSLRIRVKLPPGSFPRVSPAIRIRFY